MAKPGPARTPREVLRRRGSWLAKRNAREPVPTEKAEIGDCPDWLDDRAREAWAEIVPRLLAMNLFYKLDVGALARYCRLWSRWRQVEDFLLEHGQVHTRLDKDGQLQSRTAHPEVRIAGQLANQLIRLEQQFGLTPSARSSIETPEAPPADDRKLRFFNQSG